MGGEDGQDPNYLIGTDQYRARWEREGQMQLFPKKPRPRATVLKVHTSWPRGKES